MIDGLAPTPSKVLFDQKTNVQHLDSCSLHSASEAGGRYDSGSRSSLTLVSVIVYMQDLEVS